MISNNSINVISPQNESNTDNVEIIGGQDDTRKNKKKKRIMRSCRRCKKSKAENLCIVCSEQIKNHACFPCGHVCFCTDCSQKFLICRYNHAIDTAYDETINSPYDYCPVCRDYIIKIIKIYL